jgi:transcriptional regulator with XRE-family HTH domain
LKSNASRIFGGRVREFRQRRHLSQEAFAEKVGLDRTYISGVERGVRNPTLATMFRIANALGTSIQELVKDV